MGDLDFQYQAKNKEDETRDQANNKEDQANLCEARYQSNLYLLYQAENKEDEAKYQAKTNRGQATSETEAKYETALGQRSGAKYQTGLDVRYQAKNEEDKARDQAKNKEDQTNLGEARYQSNLHIWYQAENEEDKTKFQAKTNRGQSTSETEAKYDTALCQRSGAKYQTGLDYRYQAKNEEDEARDQAKNKEDQANLCEARYHSNLYLPYQAENEEDEAKYQAKTNRGKATSETEAKYETALCQRSGAKYQTGLDFQYRAKNEEDEATNHAKTGIGTTPQDEARCNAKVPPPAVRKMPLTGNIMEAIDDCPYEDDCRAVNKERKEDREEEVHPDIFRRIQQRRYTKSSDLVHDGATAAAFATLKRLKVAGQQEEQEQHKPGGTKTHTGCSPPQSTGLN